MVYHTIVHFEIPADDVEKLRKFYTELFGWKIERVPGPVEYWGIETVPVDEHGTPIRPGVNGGMMKKEHPEQRPVNYIACLLYTSPSPRDRQKSRMPSSA